MKTIWYTNKTVDDEPVVDDDRQHKMIFVKTAVVKTWDLTAYDKPSELWKPNTIPFLSITGHMAYFEDF